MSVTRLFAAVAGGPAPADCLLFGVAYYDEYMPYDRLDADVKMMKETGINVVRIAESTWSTLEPREGVYDFRHIDRVLACPSPRCTFKMKSRRTKNSRRACGAASSCVISSTAIWARGLGGTALPAKSGWGP